TSTALRRDQFSSGFISADIARLALCVCSINTHGEFDNRSVLASSRSRRSSSLRSARMQDLVRDRRHGHGAHVVALLQGAEMIENGAQKGEVCLQVGTEVVRMPPEVKEFPALGRRLHGRGDPPQSQALQRGAFCRRSEEAASRNIDEAVDNHRLMIVWTPDRQIAVGQAACAHGKGLLRAAARTVEPDTFVAAQGTQAKVATDRQMRRIDLVARKNNACKLDPETRGGRARRLEVGAKRLDVAPLLQAIEMREGMRSDFLGRVVENPLDEREAVIIRVALLV